MFSLPLIRVIPHRSAPPAQQCAACAGPIAEPADDVRPLCISCIIETELFDREERWAQLRVPAPPP
jgi:hypothetical protein